MGEGVGRGVRGVTSTTLVVTLMGAGVMGDREGLSVGFVEGLPVGFGVGFLVGALVGSRRPVSTWRMVGSAVAPGPPLRYTGSGVGTPGG